MRTDNDDTSGTHMYRYYCVVRFGVRVVATVAGVGGGGGRGGGGIACTTHKAAAATRRRRRDPACARARDRAPTRPSGVRARTIYRRTV